MRLIFLHYFFNNSKALTIDVKRMEGGNAMNHLLLISQAVRWQSSGYWPNKGGN